MRIGAIDLGSNSFHLLVADTSGPGKLRPVAREKKALRLGDLVARYGSISDVAADEAVLTVRQLRNRAISSGAHFVFAAATSAFRDAPNGREVLDRIELETGVHVKLIDGCEEGRLVFEAVQSSVDLADEPVVCLDLGGGSLEIVVGNQDEILWSASLPLGVARLRAQLLSSDPPDPQQGRRLSEHVTQVITSKAGPAFGFRPRLMVGAGGTFRSIGRMVASERNSTIPASINGMVIDRSELLAVSERLHRLTADMRRQLPGIGRRRSELAPAGALIVLAALEVFGHDQITVAEWTLREGLILDALANREESGWLDASRVLALAIRHQVDLSHAETVATIAVRIFDAVVATGASSGEERSLLAQAALLHDIGRSDGNDSHGKSGARTVLRELGRSGNPHILEIASLVRSHSSPTPKQSYEAFRALRPRRRQVVQDLLPLLRVADWLAKSYGADEINVEPREGGITVEVPAASSAAGFWELNQRAQHLERHVGCRVEISRSVSAFDSAAR
ncbi:MAG TPA: Ppx/GppA phosphatase family protein [Acidimicrobiales bacterium]|nr:Ppx/GppA phosphatase family protein [Acidimicrobiales bacterium]